MTGARAEALGALRRDPARTCVVSDFDGTLASIVADYEDARPLPGAVDTLLDLAREFGRVALVSGRPAAFLVERLALRPPLPDALRISGLYGLESVDADGGVTVVPEAERWREPVESAAGRAEASRPRGLRVERKGLSVTLHWRQHPEMERWALGFASAAADGLGLAVHRARGSVELRPPLPVDKGTAVTDLAGGFAAACYLGDDIGDLPAFAALERMRSAGADTRKVAVLSGEVPPELVAAADLTVDGPADALAFLRELAG